MCEVIISIGMVLTLVQASGVPSTLVARQARSQNFYLW